MLNRTHRSCRLLWTLLLLCSLVVLINASPTFAFQTKDGQEPATATQVGVSRAPGQKSGTQESPVQNQSILITATNDSGADDSTSAGKTGQSTSSVIALTPGQKFKHSLSSSFKPPMPYVLSALSGLFSEAIDNDHGRHMTAGDFLA